VGRSPAQKMPAPGITWLSVNVYRQIVKSRRRTISPRAQKRNPLYFQPLTGKPKNDIPDGIFGPAVALLQIDLRATPSLW
jgi:hypothetical protein